MEPCLGPMSLSSNGQNSQWVAVEGGTDAADDPDPWFGKAIEHRVNDDGTESVHVIWLEQCDELRGKFYQLCKSTSKMWISLQNVILFGVEIHLHLIKDSKRRVFQIITPLHIIKTIWKSRTKQVTFNELVQVLADYNIDVQQIVKKRTFVKKDKWLSQKEFSLAIYEASIK